MFTNKYGIFKMIVTWLAILSKNVNCEVDYIKNMIRGREGEKERELKPGEVRWLRLDVNIK